MKVADAQNYDYYDYDSNNYDSDEPVEPCNGCYTYGGDSSDSASGVSSSTTFEQNSFWSLYGKR